MNLSSTTQQRMMSLVRWFLAQAKAFPGDTAFWLDLIGTVSHCQTPEEFAACLQRDILSLLEHAHCYAEDAHLLIEQRVEVVLSTVELLYALRDVYLRVQEETIS
jgi:hypothetical protein